jgi:hypothetical protein
MALVDFPKMKKGVKLTFEQIHTNTPYRLFRAKVPCGWLVTWNEGITFYSDPKHEWDGNSLDDKPLTDKPLTEDLIFCRKCGQKGNKKEIIYHLGTDSYYHKECFPK